MRLRWIVVLALAALPACRRQEAGETPAAAERRLTPAQLSFLKFVPVAEVEASSLADLNGTIEFDEEHTARLAAPVPGDDHRLAPDVRRPEVTRAAQFALVRHPDPGPFEDTGHLQLEQSRIGVQGR